MWEESDFVGNIIKLNLGAPLYTEPSDSNSLIYNPAAFLVTYGIAWVFGLTKSIFAFRVIQLSFVVLTALVASNCVQKLRRLAVPITSLRYPKTWFVFTFLAMFLVATSPFANRFVYTLHVDALALLISSICFWAMLRYEEDASLSNLIFMAILPAVGFLTKQFLISWGAAMFIFLLFRSPLDLRRLSLFVILSGTLIAMSAGICILIWGDNYTFWVFDLMGGIRKEISFSPDHVYGISLARSFDHLNRLWLELFVGILGCWLLIRAGGRRGLISLGAAWLVLVASETVSSGAGWGLLYHFGPGVLIGGIFMFSALPLVWNDNPANENSQPVFAAVRAFVLCACVFAIFTAWHVVPSGDKVHPRFLKALQQSPDVDRYIGEIEQEFEGYTTESVLLGVGNWIYLRDDVLQKDRAVSLADQPFGGFYENFDVTIERIRSRKYQKLLMQNFDSPRFLYEWNLWSRPSGFRNAVLENYVEVRRIQAPEGNPLLPFYISMADEVTVFVPRDSQ